MSEDRQRLAYREKFRSVYGEAFQSWFETLARALHAPGDFQALRKTSGDGGLDGYVINAQLVYQVYAPAEDLKRRDRKTAAKIKEDFSKAQATLSGNLKSWVFVHNHPEAKLGQLSIAAINALTTGNPAVEVGVLNIESLWDRLSALSEETKRELFGEGDKGSTANPIPQAVRDIIRVGVDLLNGGHMPEARDEFRKAVALAEGLAHPIAIVDAKEHLALAVLHADRDSAAAKDLLQSCLAILGEHEDERERAEVLDLSAQDRNDTRCAK
jgi:hypothetical protein